MECAGKGSRGRCCEAVAYCSISHQISHWSIHKEECERLERQMKQAEGLNDFPFTFSQEAIDAQVHEKHESRFSFLIRQGVHQLGMWSYECSCGASTSSSSSRLIDGWNLASTLSPCKGPSSSIPNQLTCWKDYYKWRCIPLYSPVALLLHWPLTLYWANQLESSRGLLNRVSGKFCIHYLAPNAGIAAYRSWLPTIVLLKEMKVPAVFSDLCEEASRLAISCISTITGSPPAIPIQLNPFRHPLPIEDTALLLPCGSNCFVFGM